MKLDTSTDDPCDVVTSETLEGWIKTTKYVDSDTNILIKGVAKWKR